MKILVINVLDRTDRLESISRLLEEKMMAFEVVKAVDKHEFNTSSNPFLTIDVERILKSHLKCMEICARSENEFVLILEDDSVLEIDLKELNILAEQAINSNLDFLQIGFLKLNTFDRAEIVLRNFYDYLIRLGYLSNFLLRFGFKESARAKSQVWRTSLSAKFVLNDIRYGAHSYMVSTAFARQLLLLKEPNYLAIDDLFVALGRMKSFRMARLRRSRSSQSDSTSSVLTRYKQDSFD